MQFQRNSTSKRTRGLRAALACAVGAVGLVALSTPFVATARAQDSCNDPWPLRRALFMYTHSALPTSVLDQIADRFDFAVEGYRPDIEYMINRNSRFKFVAMYNSLTDNYIGDDSENRWLFENAAQYGVDPEDVYIHFWEDTVVELQGQNITIPGWNPNRQAGDPPATAATRAEARVPVYFSNLSRRVTSFRTQALRDLNIGLIVHRLTQPMIGGIHPGGVMFDNSANQSLQVRIVSGGRVQEAPNHPVFNSDEFMDWYWMGDGGVRTYLEQLTNYVDDNRSLFGGRRIHIIPNTANAPYIGSSRWEESYIDPPAADILSLEFEYNPTRNFGRDMPRIIYEKHTAALNAGVGIFETGYLLKSRGDVAGSFTDEEAVVNNVAAHWVHRADDEGKEATTYILGANVWDAVNQLDKFRLNLAPIFDYDLGRPLTTPYVVQEGTDPKGYAYRVYGRQLQCGFALVRHRDPYDGDFDGATAVEVQLDGEYVPINFDGTLGQPTTTWTLRNGEGQIFLSTGVERDDVPPGAPGNLREGE